MLMVINFLRLRQSLGRASNRSAKSSPLLSTIEWRLRNDGSNSTTRTRWRHPQNHKKTKNAPSPPGSQAWKIERLLLELDNSPITNKLDVDFLKEAIVLQRNTVEAAMDASHQEKLVALEKSWTGKYPYLRLIHCLIDFQKTRRMYLYRDSADPTQYSCENRNNPEKSRETVWEVLSNQWNDSDFELTTRGLEHLHSDFKEESLCFEQVKYMTKADPEKIHSKFAAMVVEMGRCIANWERSGQGDGGVEAKAHPDDKKQMPGGELHGLLDNRSVVALGNLANFFKSSNTYLLYLWQVLHTHQLLGSTLQRLSDEVSAGNGLG